MEYVVKGPCVPRSTIDDRTITKPSKEWDDIDKKLYSLGAKAMNILYCRFNADEFNRISICKNSMNMGYFRSHS